MMLQSTLILGSDMFLKGSFIVALNADCSRIDDSLFQKAKFYWLSFIELKKNYRKIVLSSRWM